MSYIVVGSGYAGSVAARFLAEKMNEKVLIIEKRNHIAGNMYDYINETGILTHKYGPHISVMKHEKVFNFLSRFTEWIPYEHRVNALIEGKEVPLPINFNSIMTLYPPKRAQDIILNLLQNYGANSLVPVLKLISEKNDILRQFGEDIYEKVFLHYTMKMWGVTPQEIDPAVTGRIPIRLSFDNRHFLHPYQVMPKKGFTYLFKKMLDHPNIKIQLNTEAKEILNIDMEAKQIYAFGRKFEGSIIYTGALDELFQFCYGELPYRSLKFTFLSYEEDSIQNVPVLNWPDQRPETRRTEMKKLTGQRLFGKTTAIIETPGQYNKNSKDFNEPLYPISKNEYNQLYEKYKLLADQFDRFYPIGRLADYKYYNM